jgi:hypothetical protein
MAVVGGFSHFVRLADCCVDESRKLGDDGSFLYMKSYKRQSDETNILTET